MSQSEFASGWRVLAAATLGVGMATTAIPFYSLGVLVTPLEQATGWSRTDISAAATLLGFSLPVAMLWLGGLIDRFGTRLVAASGQVVLAAVFFLLSFTGENIWWFWTLYVAAGLLAVGATPVTFSRAVISEFDRRRGLAIGICMAGAGLGAAIAPPLLNLVVLDLGWPAGYRALGVVALCLVPVTLGWLRTRADSRSSEPGVKAPQTGSSRNPRTALLVVLCVLFFAIALSVNGYIVHLIPLMIDSGVSPRQAAWTGGAMGVFVIIGRLLTGYLLDKLPATLLGAVACVLAGAGLTILALFGSSAALLAAVLLGLSIGAEVDIVAYLISRSFHESQYSRYFSFAYSAFMLGSGLSPLMAGWIVDRYATYEPFLRFSRTVLLAVAIAFVALHLVDRRQTRFGRCAAPGP